MKKRRYRRLFAVLTAAMFSACNVSTALAMPLQELTEDYQDFNTKLVEESRPKDIGSDAFSEWFFTYLEEETLWDWFYGVMEDDTNEDYSALYSWYEKNQEQIAKQSGANASALMASSVGDLWNNWIDGNFDLTGDGTESNPYQIEDLEDLMIMTQAIAAGTGNYDTAHYRLMDDIDLSFTINNGNWNPIGWYQNAAQLSGNVSNSFKGTFDGDGHTISGLKIVNISKNLQNVGLFGVLDGAVVKNLVIEDARVYGYNHVGILAGQIKGESVITDVTVEGTAAANTSSGGYASDAAVGGLAGKIFGSSSGSRATIENVTATVNTVNLGATSKTGGIAGEVSNAYIVDTSVSATGNNILGRYYVGGIVGAMSSGTSLYNVSVDGTIGGNGAYAVGGITGYYEGGEIVVARMFGEIGKTNAGTAREGIFIGTRKDSVDMKYGTTSGKNLAYWFTTVANKTKAIVGSGKSSDTTVTDAAHIGYWNDNEVHYYLKNGANETYDASRYFYEELEDGIRNIVVTRLDRDFTVADYENGLPFSIDHYAPGTYGQPVKGYLLSVSRVDVANSNGTFDQDVATFTAYPGGANSFYRIIDKDSSAAVRPGETVHVTTAAKNTNGSIYQMVTDENEPGGVKPPTYTDEDGNPQDMTYQTGGGYTFEMPEHSTELDVEYIRTTSKLSMDPANVTFHVVQTRTGDRKNPTVQTVVLDGNNNQLATYTGNDLSAINVNPVTVNAVHNDTGASTDKTHSWSIDDSDLVVNASDAGYVETAAKIKPNMAGSWINGLLNKAVKAQQDNNYLSAIPATVTSKNAILTASTNADTSPDHKSVYGNVTVTVDFKIVDETTLRVEGVELNKNNITYTITRKLTGDRKNPTETIFADEPQILAASLRPAQSFTQNVRWEDENPKQYLKITPQGSFEHELKVEAKYDPNGADNPAWIQNVINADNQKRDADPYEKLSGTATQVEHVTVTSEDATNGHQTADCEVTLKFVTVDETVIHPESVQMGQQQVKFDLQATKEGDINSAVKTRTGFDPVQLSCTVLPDCSSDALHTPYNREVIWSVSDTDVASISQTGLLAPNPNAQWIKDAEHVAPYTGTKTIKAIATTVDGQKVGETTVVLNYAARCIEMPETETLDLVLTMTGRRNSPTYTFGDMPQKQVIATTYQEKRPVTYSSSNTSVLQVSADGTIRPVQDAGLKWIRKACVSPYTGTIQAVITGTDATGSDSTVVTLKITVSDQTTYSSSSSSGGGGGGGGGSHSSKAVATSGTTPAASSLPEYVVRGTWTEAEQHKWTFRDDTRTYASEWAAIYNPYADKTKDQQEYDWFRFDESGYMVTGWFTDVDGNRYYLNPVSDGTQGRMVTGWYWIDGMCYYFNPVSNGTRGAMKRNCEIDGYQLNADGIWVVNGVVQTK